MAARPIYLGSVDNFATRILTADSTNLVTLVTGAASGTKVITISATTDETVARDVQFWLTISAVDYLLGTVNIPIGAGFSGSVPALDILGSANLPWVRFDSDGAKYLYLESGNILKAKSLVALTAAKTIYFTMQGGSF